MEKQKPTVFHTVGDWSLPAIEVKSAGSRPPAALHAAFARWPHTGRTPVRRAETIKDASKARARVLSRAAYAHAKGKQRARPSSAAPV